MVDAAVQFLGFLEQGVQLGPVGDIRLDIGGLGPSRVGRRRNIRVDDCGAEGQQQCHCGETDA